jgi:hypothetical protein
MSVTATVRQQAQRFFSPTDAEKVIVAFEATSLPLIANNGERVYLAILLLARGDMERFWRELQQAKTDWRDTLVAAGLANGDWSLVLRSQGISIGPT